MWTTLSWRPFVFSKLNDLNIFRTTIYTTKNILKLTSRMIIYKLPIKVQGEFCKCRNWFSDVFCVTCFTTHIQASARHKLCRLPLSLSSFLLSSLFLPQNSIDIKSIDWEGFHFFAVVKSLADSLVFEHWYLNPERSQYVFWVSIHGCKRTIGNTVLFDWT